MENLSKDRMGFMPTPRPWWSRLLRRFSLFSSTPEWPFIEADGATSEFNTESEICLGIKDTLRVMLGGVITVRLSVTCEVEQLVPRESQVNISVRSPRYRRIVRRHQKEAELVKKATKRLKGTGYDKPDYDDGAVQAPR